MKTTDTFLIVGALAIAAGLVLLPRRPRESRLAGFPAGLVNPYAAVGVGDGSTVWGAPSISQYIEQIRGTQDQGDGWTG